MKSRSAVAEGTEPPAAKCEPESLAKVEPLMEEVSSERTWKALKSQGQQRSPGVDGMTVGTLAAYLQEHWPTIRERLLDGTYQPQPVKRVEIPKPDGGVRQAWHPHRSGPFHPAGGHAGPASRWDRTFSEHSYGFRPGRSAHQAVAQAQQYPAEGDVVVDIDLEKFFDRVNHDILMGRIAKRVSTSGCSN